MDSILELLMRRVGRYDRRVERIEDGALPEMLQYLREDRELDGAILALLSRHTEAK